MEKRELTGSQRFKQYEPFPCVQEVIHKEGYFYQYKQQSIITLV